MEEGTAQRSVSDAATEWAFTAGWRLVRRLPEPVARKAFDRIAITTWRRRGPSVRQLERNLARVFPDAHEHEIRELSRESMRSYMRYWCEAFILPSWSQDRIRSSFELVNKELLDEAAASGSGAIVVAVHGGNWDLAGAYGALRYGSVATVVEHLKPEGLFQQFLEYRKSLGIDIWPLGDPGAFRGLADRLRAGGVVALVGDRDISRNGLVVDFFGAPASMPAGPALLAQLTGAPLFPLDMWFEGDRAFAEVRPRIEIPETGTREEITLGVTQRLAHAFAEGITKHGAHWHMLQPLWLSDLRPRDGSTEKA